MVDLRKPLPLQLFEAPGVIDEQGQLQMEDLAEFRRAMKRFGRGLRVTVRVEEAKEKRSKTWEQVKYWWAVPVALVADHCGMTDRQAHVALLGECFGYVEGFGGKVVPAEPAMSDLTVDKMKHLIDWVQTWGPAALELIIPPPDKNWRSNAELIRQQRGAA